MYNYRSIYQLYKKKKIIILVLVGGVFAVSRLNVYSQTVIGNIIDNIKNSDFGFYIMLFIVINITLYASKLLMTVLGKKLSCSISNTFKKQLCKKIINVKYEFLKKYNTSDIFQMWNKDIDELQKITDNYINFSMVMLSAVFAAIQLFKISKWIIIIALLVNLAAMSPILFLSKKSKRISQQMRESEIKMNDKFQRLFKYIRIIKAFGKEDKEIHEFEGKNEQYVDDRLSFLVIERIHKSLISIIDSFVQVVVLIIGSFAVMNGQMTIGSIVVAISLLSSINKPFSESGKIFVDFKTIGFKFQKLEQFLSGSEEDRKGETNLALDDTFTLRFNKVCYEVNKKVIVKDIDFEIFSGEKVAIVGESGSGKTTLNNMLLRLYDPSEGEILLNNKNIRDYNIDFYRNNIHYSQSDTYLLNDTIRNNLMIFGAKEEEIIRIAKAIGFHEEICRFEKGYDTVINPGASNISGGQKKKLEIIRATARSKEIYIFDEITKGIDNFSSNAVITYITESLNKTVIITMHDLLHIEKFDKIVVMKEGKIIGIGNHEKLLTKCPYYKELYKNNNRRK